MGGGVRTCCCCVIGCWLAAAAANGPPLQLVRPGTLPGAAAGAPFFLHTPHLVGLLRHANLAQLLLLGPVVQPAARGRQGLLNPAHGSPPLRIQGRQLLPLRRERSGLVRHLLAALLQLRHQLCNRGV